MIDTQFFPIRFMIFGSMLMRLMRAVLAYAQSTAAMLMGWKRQTRLE